MNLWKTGSLTGALILSAAVGAAVMPRAAAQSAEREPIARALQIIGRGPQIGVTVRDPSAEEAKQGGIVVDDVRGGSPAEKAGVKRGDRIVEFDGERVRSVAQFRRLVEETPEGRAAGIVVQRDGQRVTASVTPERAGGAFYVGDDFLRLPPSPPAAPAPPAAPRLPRSFDRDFDFMYQSSDRGLGASFENLSDQLRTYFGVKEGVLVRSVREGTAAAAAGLKAGDIVTAVNGRHVDEPQDVGRELRGIDSGGEFTLEVSRDRKPMTLKGKLDAREDRARSRTSTEL